MNQTPLCRRVFLVGLATQVLVPTTRASAQGSAAPTQPGRAPFGLTWGMSAESARNLYRFYKSDVMGVEMDLPLFFYLQDGEAKLQRSSGLPQNMPNDTSEAGLSFGGRNRLYHVYAEGQPGQADAVMERYKKFSSLLSEFYGPGTESVAAVAAQGWFRRTASKSTLRETSFSTNEVLVSLSLISDDDDKMHWFISYFNRAGLAEAKADKAKADEAKSEKEKDAL